MTTETEHERVLRLTNIAGISVVGKEMILATKISSVQNLINLINLVRTEALEEAAVIAWNHYMDTCKKKGISPVTFQDYCAASAIRAIKDK